MKSLILITCCGTKNLTTGNENTENPNAITNFLSKEKSEKLIRLREKTFDAFNDKIDFESGFMNANERYMGLIYKPISKETWNKISNSDSVDLLIFSALYGLLKFNDPILNYNVMMTDDIEDRIKLNKWWRINEIGSVLIDYIKRNNIVNVYNLLSNSYSTAIGNTLNDFETIKPSLPRGYGLEKGHWIEENIGLL